jgi:membrane protease subunit HflK
MRRTGAPSQIALLATPLVRLLDAGWQRMHWWIATMAVLYLVSGITVVRSDEVAVVQRWGRLVGATPALQEHGPGLLFAFPRPIDRIVRVPIKRVNEVSVSTLNGEMSEYRNTLDPLSGYAVTGDQNIVHVDMVARYHIRDAAEWAFYGPSADDVLRAEVTGAMVRSIGEMGVDRVLSDGRKDLAALTTRRAQAGLDLAHSGLELTSLELTRLAAPTALAADFAAVQSAYIGAQTQQNEAQAYAAGVVPSAQAEADASVQGARGEASAILAAAIGGADAFRALLQEYRSNPPVVRERLYRDAVERAIARAGNVRWIPPPFGAKYTGLRISIAPDGTALVRAPGAPSADEDEGRR